MIGLALAFTLVCNECNTTVWQLFYQGEPVAFSDMETKAECEALKADIDKQTPAFTALECREVPVMRQDS